MKIDECDYCGEQRYITEGKDSFGVHVVNLCAYGCNDNRSIPLNTDSDDIVARCENCRTILKPEDKIELKYSDVYCSKYCVAEPYHYDDIEYVSSTTIICDNLTTGELQKYNLKIIERRLCKEIPLL